jgi:hypothetical protein
MDASLLGGGALLLNMNFKNKWQITERKNEKSVFVLKHVRVILRKVQKSFRLRGQYTEQLQRSSAPQEAVGSLYFLCTRYNATC